MTTHTNKANTNATNGKQTPLLLKIGKVSQLTGMAKTTILGYIEKGDFPPPKQIGETRYWHADTIYQWIEQFKQVNAPNTTTEAIGMTQ